MVQDTKADIDRFAHLIRKYTSFEKLDRFMYGCRKNNLALRLFVISSSRESLSYNGVILVFVIASASLHKICSKCVLH
nr:DUF4368 domain-containing protein [Petralouisia muris]